MEAGMRKADRSQAMAKPTTSEIQSALISWLQYKSRSLVMANVYMNHSPWESDVIDVTKAYFWHEYEIKISVADYRNDFTKKINGFSKNSKRKHDFYKSQEQVMRYGDAVPKPKTFTFVVPRGLLDGLDVPMHCGVIEYEDSRDWSIWKIQRTRAPVKLPKPTKLDQSQIYNLARKAADRVKFKDQEARP